MLSSCDYSLGGGGLFCNSTDRLSLSSLLSSVATTAIVILNSTDESQ